jgi:hypothetical protein
MKWTLPKIEGFSADSILKFCLISALLLTTSMALLSDYNRHPDEIHHFEAAKYYTRHFLPPEIGDESVRASYSVYGVSYLNYHWTEYFLTGKFMFFLSFLDNPLLAARFFQVFLFAILVFFFWRNARRTNSSALTIGAFLLVSPQIWYIFSYVNNDPFALFISLLIADQMARPSGFLNNFLQNGKFVGGVWFGFLVGILLTCKTNYWVFLVFAALWLIFNVPFNLIVIKRYAFIALVALSFVGFRLGLDFYVNGETNFVGLSYVNYFLGDFEKKQGKLLAYQEQVADICCKQSTIENDLTNTHPDLKLRAKGVSLTDLFAKRDWHKISFWSFTGGYGYMTVFAGKIYYRLMMILYAAFGLYLAVSIILSREKQSVIQLLITIFGFALTVFVSVYLSWTYAFQAQGRYLFPVVGMIGMLIYANRRHLRDSIVHAFFVGAFLLAVYSFVFVGLARINSE